MTNHSPPTTGSLWPIKEAADTVNQTYEMHADLASYNYRARELFTQLRNQVDNFWCSGAVYTQTTDVEGEVNGLVTYDRRVMRVDVAQWKEDVEALLAAAEAKSR